MESEVIGILEWNQEVNDIQNGEIQNYARFKHMMVNRTGKLDVLLRQCNRGYEVQCFGGIEGGSSSLMILFIVVIIIGLMLVFGLIYMYKKKRELERKIEALSSSSENITPFQD